MCAGQQRRQGAVERWSTTDGGKQARTHCFPLPALTFCQRLAVCPGQRRLQHGRVIHPCQPKLQHAARGGRRGHRRRTLPVACGAPAWQAAPAVDVFRRRIGKGATLHVTTQSKAMLACWLPFQACAQPCLACKAKVQQRAGGVPELAACAPQAAGGASRSAGAAAAAAVQCSRGRRRSQGGKARLLCCRLQ